MLDFGNNVGDKITFWDTFTGRTRDVIRDVELAHQLMIPRPQLVREMARRLYDTCTRDELELLAVIQCQEQVELRLRENEQADAEPNEPGSHEWYWYGPYALELDEELAQAVRELEMEYFGEAEAEAWAWRQRIVKAEPGCYEDALARLKQGECPWWEESP